MTIRRLAILPPVLLGAAILWLALETQPAPPVIEPAERRVPVSVVTAAPRAFVPRVSGYGTVAPARVWTAIAQVAGPVTYLNPSFARGGFVAEGEVLVRIAPEDYALALEAAEADLAHAVARVEEMRATGRTTEASLEIEAQSLELTKVDLERTARLGETGIVSSSVVEARRRDVLAQRSKVQTLENTLALLPAQIDALEQTAASARVAYRAAALDLARTVVKAPFDARVSRIDVEISQYVGAGASIGALDGAAAAEIDVQLSARLLASLARLAGLGGAMAHNGAARQTLPALPAGLRRVSAARLAGLAAGDMHRLTARVSQTASGDPATWAGEVVRISDTVSPETRAIGLIVRVGAPYAARDTAPGDAPRPPLMKGMFVRVDLEAPAVPGVILLPRSAIRNGQVMLAGANSRLRYAPVSPLFVQEGIAVLAPGALPAAARVVTSDPAVAIEGLLLAPMPDHAAEARLARAAAGLAP
ncbi:MAG: hemolysin D [Pseudomonadota bacterium]